jgi:hypothetical protein
VIVISSNGNGWGERLQFLQDFGLSDIAGVNDEVNGAEDFPHLRP